MGGLAMIVGNLSRRAVKVIHGANDGTFDLAGARVATVRSSLVDAFNIPSGSIAFVNGEQVDGGYVLQADDTLEFCKQLGIKGKRRMLTKAQILGEYTGYPADVMDELFAKLRHDDVNADGNDLWHEGVVDEWLDGFYSRKRADDGRDKMIPPKSARINGQVCDDLTPNEWRLLEALLAVENQSAEVGKVVEHIYGHDADFMDNALIQVIKRLNRKCVDSRWPFTIHMQNGWVSLEK